MSEALQRAKGIAEAATPGPWKSNPSDRGVNRIQDAYRLPLVGYIAYEHDAEFIATFNPETVSALLDAVAAAKVVEETTVPARRSDMGPLDVLATKLERVEALLPREEGQT